VADHLTRAAQVAVKFMAAVAAQDDELVARFRREAAASAQIKSPHIVQVFDHGVASDGSLYIVMELLDGEDLKSRNEPNRKKSRRALAASVIRGGAVLEPGSEGRLALGQAPFFEDLSGHGLGAAVCGEGGGEEPGFEFLGLGGLGGGAFQKIALEGEADGVGGGVALAAAAAAVGSGEGAHEQAAEVGGRERGGRGHGKSRRRLQRGSGAGTRRTLREWPGSSGRA